MKIFKLLSSFINPKPKIYYKAVRVIEDYWNKDGFAICNLEKLEVGKTYEKFPPFSRYMTWHELLNFKQEEYAACEKPEDMFWHSPFNVKNCCYKIKFFEVALDKIVLNFYNQTIADKMTILRELSTDEVLELVKYNVRILFRYMPIEMAHSLSLKRLQLLENNYNIPSEDLEKWNWFDLSNLELTLFPEKILKCNHLTMLTLEDNHISFLPEGIGDLSELNELYIACNNLKTLPDSVSKLTNLKILDLRDNRFTDETKIKIKTMLPNCKIIF